MPLTTYKIDPFADTVIILTNPCKNFAPWKTDNPDDEAPDSEPLVDENSPARKLSKKEKGDSVKEARARNLELTLGVDDKAQNTAESLPEPAEDDEVYYLVSSRHLILASPWFRRALTDDRFVESSKEPSDGLYHLTASDWDEEAFLILLNIFHVRTRQVPATVSLEMLAKIAVLVDYYELQNAEVLDHDLKGWISHLRGDFIHPYPYCPDRYCRDLMLWMCVSEVYGLREEFRYVTDVAIATSKGSIETLGLPIRQSTIVGIGHRRCVAIEKIIEELHRLLEVCRDVNYSCSTEPRLSWQCSAFTLGILTKCIQLCGPLSACPIKPFMGINVRKFWIRNREMITWGPPNSNVVHACRTTREIDRLIFRFPATSTLYTPLTPLNIRPKHTCPPVTDPHSPDPKV